VLRVSLNPYSIILNIFLLDIARAVYVSVTSTMLTSTVLTALSEKESREDKEMEKLVAKALMLPYSIKSMKLEGNKIVIEIEGGESEQSKD
jgi:hypothetical protein